VSIARGIQPVFVICRLDAIAVSFASPFEKFDQFNNQNQVGRDLNPLATLVASPM
jgi:hypothetical protein